MPPNAIPHLNRRELMGEINRAGRPQQPIKLRRWDSPSRRGTRRWLNGETQRRCLQRQRVAQVPGSGIRGRMVDVAQTGLL